MPFRPKAEISGFICGENAGLQHVETDSGVSSIDSYRSKFIGYLYGSCEAMRCVYWDVQTSSFRGSAKLNQLYPYNGPAWTCPGNLSATGSDLTGLLRSVTSETTRKLIDNRYITDALGTYRDSNPNKPTERSHRNILIRLLLPCL